MKTLIVGAGATGGYIGTKLIEAGRDVTFLARRPTASRLRKDGVRVELSNGRTVAKSVEVQASGDFDGQFDVVVLAVRSDAVNADLLKDIAPVIAPTTRILPIVNGMLHVQTLVDAYDATRVLGGTARLATSLRTDGVIQEVAPGVSIELGALDGIGENYLPAVAAELDVDGITVDIRDDIISAMWAKFAFIVATASLTCLMGAVIGPINAAPGGSSVAMQIVDEVAAVAAAESHPLGATQRSVLEQNMTDVRSTFAPSMFRDFTSQRPVEVSVLIDLADRARRWQIATPLFDAAIVRIELAGVSGA